MREVALPERLHSGTLAILEVDNPARDRALLVARHGDTLSWGETRFDDRSVSSMFWNKSFRQFL
jgi:hypothetical protein